MSVPTHGRPWASAEEPLELLVDIRDSLNRLESIAERIAAALESVIETDDEREQAPDAGHEKTSEIKAQ